LSSLRSTFFGCGIAALAWLAAACAGDGHPAATLSGDPADFRWALPAGWTAPAVPADNPMSPAKVELGRRLFYDTRLSGNGGFSCASCHRQEFGVADARNIPVGSTGEPHPRNSMGIANSAWLALFNWVDPTTPSLEQQALVPMFGDRPVELGLKGQEAVLLDRLRAVALYRELFAASFPGVADPITVANLTRALAAFQRTVVAVDSPFDRAMRGEQSAMSAAAQRGEALFRSSALRCAECHRGPLFTAAADVVPGRAGGDSAFANNGLYNLGGTGAYPASNRGLIARTGRAEDMGKFRIPSLRNLAFTFPYMHDGSVSTLEAVVEHYDRGGRLVATGPNAGDGRLSPVKDPRITPLGLTAQQKGDLVAFLRSLSDSALVREPRFANPWVLR
jgi:cytochrome c peroxidase